MAGYIGNIPTPQATQSRQSFTATASQTTFATIGYTPNFVDVYLNGVHLLNGTDYTATNSSDVVLTVGAAVSDVVEVISYETFTVLDQTFTGTTTTDVLTTTGAFTSLGIDDNATATAMTLDASGNLLVGTTNLTNYNNNAGTTADDGFVYLAQGILSVSSNKTGTGFVQYLNRTGTDGGIIDFRKDGATVGSIGTSGGDLYVGTGDTTLKFSDAADVIVPTGTNGAARSGFLSLGNGSNKFKDLYLSGGVYLGGTGSANKLDDYEEGTWTPSLPGLTLLIADGSYTKVGSMVTAQFRISSSSATDSAAATIDGLPFVPTRNTESGRSAGFLTYNPSGTSMTLLFSNGTDTPQFREDTTGSSVTRTTVSGNLFWGTLVYTTAS